MAQPARKPESKLIPIRRDPTVWELFDTSWARQGTLDEYLAVVLDRCAEWFGASGASLFLHSEVSDEFPLAAKAGTETQVPDDATVYRGKGIAGACIENRQPILLDDPSSHPALNFESSQRRHDIGSALVVPLITSEAEVLGVLNLARSASWPAFQANDLELAQSIAGHLALAVANGRLLSKLRRSVSYSAELHRRLDTIIESLAVGIVVLRRNATISHLNPEAASFSKGAEVNQEWRAFVAKSPAPIREALKSVSKSALAGERPVVFIEDSAGDRAFTISGAPLQDGGATLVIQNSSEQARMQREIARVKRLAEIGQLTSAIAHEIRNPLSAMRGAAQVIQSDPEHAAEMARIIELEVDKLNELCSDFLDFARPIELSHEQISLAKVTRHVCELHRGDFQNAGIELEVDIREPLQEIWADSRRIEQVVHNLLLNALQASQRASVVQVSVTGREMVVQDQGCGMEEHIQANLFTPFLTTKANGTGLGLSTVKKIVDAHGGQIAVQSKVGEGTTIRIFWGNVKG